MNVMIWQFKQGQSEFLKDPTKLTKSLQSQTTPRKSRAPTCGGHTLHFYFLLLTVSTFSHVLVSFSFGIVLYTVMKDKLKNIYQI